MSKKIRLPSLLVGMLLACVTTHAAAFDLLDHFLASNPEGCCDLKSCDTKCCASPKFELKLPKLPKLPPLPDLTGIFKKKGCGCDSPGIFQRRSSCDCQPLLTRCQHCGAFHETVMPDAGLAPPPAVDYLQPAPNAPHAAGDDADSDIPEPPAEVVPPMEPNA